MKLAACRFDGAEEACILTEAGAVSLRQINRITGANWPTELLMLLKQGQLKDLADWLASADCTLPDAAVVPYEQVQYAPLYRNPRKIWGIGFNYVENPEQLSQISMDEEPVGFMKPDTSLIGYGDAICIPHQSERTTAEAELAIIIGQTCRNVSVQEAALCIAGYTTAIDVTADDIHKRNPRFLTRAKSFDTFFSFGPSLVTPDSVPDLPSLEVATVLNGTCIYQNRVSNMRYHPFQIVAFHSAVMTLLPGDVIMTGTPGAVQIQNGDVVQCRIAGFETLENGVVDLKNLEGRCARS